MLIFILILPKQYRNNRRITSDLLSAMPTEIGVDREPQVGDMIGVLQSRGWTLAPVGMRYRANGGQLFNLMQEKKCSLILNIMLTDHEGDSWRHFVAWDGSIIHDHPYICKVNKVSDRTREGSRALFKKFFPQEDYKKARVCSVFELQRCPPRK